MIKNHSLATLCDRTLIKIDGKDSEQFLHNLITTDVEHLKNDIMLPGALLTPQAKIAYDFLLGKKNDSYFIDINETIAADLIKRLSLYKLRAQVNISQPNPCIVEIIDTFDNQTLSTNLEKNDDILFFHDKRFLLNCNVFRIYNLKKKQEHIDSKIENYTNLRIKNAVAESGTDFQLNDAFPHDINLDQINGVSFKKGCYIGQEVVSRMHHRKTARRRILIVKGNSSLPQPGTIIEADGKPLGTLGTVSGHDGLALVRIDRVKQAIDKAMPIYAENIELHFKIPQTVNFTFPDKEDKTNES